MDTLLLDTYGNMCPTVCIELQTPTEDMNAELGLKERLVRSVIAANYERYPPPTCAGQAILFPLISPLPAQHDQLGLDACVHWNGCWPASGLR